MKKRNQKLYLWLLPMLIFLISLVILPLLMTIRDSLFEVSLLDTEQKTFAGVSNYKKIFTDKNVIQGFINTSFYVITALLAETILGVLIAVGLNRKSRMRGVLVAILILPWALPPLVNGIMWKLIFEPTSGMINSALMKIGLMETPFIWLNNPELSKICIIIVHIWKMLPLISIIFMAKMQTIPEEIMEASALDGSGRIKQFFTMTLPNIRNVLLITLTQGCIGAFHLFDEPYSMTGTASDTRSLLIQDYIIAFREYDLGKGMALALVISFSLLLVMAILGLVIREGTKDE